MKGFDIVIVGLSVLGYDFELASSLDAACRSLGLASACYAFPFSASAGLMRRTKSS